MNFKKIALYSVLTIGGIAIGVYLAGNLDLSLSNAARALVNQSAQEMWNAPETFINKVQEKTFTPEMPNVQNPMSNISPF